jgi:hypothetical protein
LLGPVVLIAHIGEASARMTTPSHILKLKRADEHLKEIDALTEPLGERREYPVIETMKSQHDGPCWEYVLDLSGVVVPERLPILIGDYLFNVRSGLDHLLVSMVPKKYRRKAGLPIYRANPLARDPANGNYRNAEAASRWLSLCCCLPDDCIAPLTRLQPYHTGTLYRRDAEHHALALLSGFQNADKHRELVDAVVNLTKIELGINGETTYVVPAFHHGTVVVTGSYEKMDVKVKGVASVGIQRGKELWGFDMMIDRLVQFVSDAVLPSLEPFAKEP